MDVKVPQDSEELTAVIQNLRIERERRKTEQKAKERKRRGLAKHERAKILAKTDARCHICGGGITGHWDADHVLAHSSGGTHGVENYLPAHGICNNYHWDYLAEEFQLILKLGVFVRETIEKNRPLGREVAVAFMKKEKNRRSRQVRNQRHAKKQ